LGKLVSSEKVSLEDAMAFAENPELVRARGKEDFPHSGMII